MFFKLVHEVGNRQRWITTGTMTTASAELIADDVSVIAGVSGVKVEGGGLILEKGLVEKDFEDLAKEGGDCFLR